MVDGAAEIAGHVGLQYKLDSGDQLVSIRSSSLELQGEEIGVAVRPTGGELQFLEGDGLLYILNGLGPNGTIPTGTASKKRGRLLLREALELALYSFRYLDDVTMVAVLLPQAARSRRASRRQQTRAVFYRPGDLLEQLQVPLDRHAVAEDADADDHDAGRVQARRRPHAAQPLPGLGPAARGRPELPRAGRARHDRVTGARAHG